MRHLQSVPKSHDPILMTSRGVVVEVVPINEVTEDNELPTNIDLFILGAMAR